MLKVPRPHAWKTSRKFGKYFILFEVTLFGASYVVWRRMNRSQEFRHYMHKNFPTILEGYYLIGETISKSTLMREVDLMTWEKDKAKSE